MGEAYEEVMEGEMLDRAKRQHDAEMATLMDKMISAKLASLGVASPLMESQQGQFDRLIQRSVPAVQCVRLMGKLVVDDDPGTDVRSTRFSYTGKKYVVSTDAHGIRKVFLAFNDACNRAYLTCDVRIKRLRDDTILEDELRRSLVGHVKRWISSKDQYDFHLRRRKSSKADNTGTT
jgi:hypothetical protein